MKATHKKIEQLGTRGIARAAVRSANLEHPRDEARIHYRYVPRTNIWREAEYRGVEGTPVLAESHLIDGLLVDVEIHNVRIGADDLPLYTEYHAWARIRTADPLEMLGHVQRLKTKPRLNKARSNLSRLK